MRGLLQCRSVSLLNIFGVKSKQVCRGNRSRLLMKHLREKNLQTSCYVSFWQPRHKSWLVNLFYISKFHTERSVDERSPSLSRLSHLHSDQPPHLLASRLWAAAVVVRRFAVMIIVIMAIITDILITIINNVRALFWKYIF